MAAPQPAGRIVQFAVSTGAIIRTVKVKPLPAEIVAAPDGRHVYVDTAEAGSDTVTAIGTTSSDRTVRTIRLAGQPLDMETTPDGRFLYLSVANTPVSNASVGSVVVIRTAGFRLVKTIDVNMPSEVAISPAGKMVYVLTQAKRGDETVTPIRTATNAAGKAIRIASSEFGGSEIQFTPSRASPQPDEACLMGLVWLKGAPVKARR